jgi:hypothetical protein
VDLQYTARSTTFQSESCHPPQGTRDRSRYRSWISSCCWLVRRRPSGRGAAGLIDARSVVAAIENTQADLLALREQVALVASGQVQRVTLGSGDMGDVFIDRDGLVLMDRIFTAYTGRMLGISALETALGTEPGLGFGLFEHGLTVGIDESRRPGLYGPQWIPARAPGYRRVGRGQCGFG